MTSAGALRGDRRAQTRERLRTAAMSLFLAQGFEQTTVAQIAAAAQLSQMTFFRYFPTKEDAVLSDEHDALMVQLIRAQPTDRPALQRIHIAVRMGLGQVYPQARDELLARSTLILTTASLRARLSENLAASQATFELALSSQDDVEIDLSTRVVASVASACLAAAVMAWVAEAGRQELPELVDRAFADLHREACALAHTSFEQESTG